MSDLPKFSIFNPVITHEHREFYERIISELSGIFPICNQGKCTAVEISESVTEQEQITDLMKKVENFSFQLLGVTKRLFDQFYQAKEDFFQSIYSTTAYIKINLLDRNLLERTCDVRWWSLEAAFCDCLAHFDAIGSNLPALVALSEKNNERTAQSGALAEIARVHTDGVGVLANDQRLASFNEALAGLEAGAFSMSKEQGDALQRLKALALDVSEKVRFACERLEDINSSYTLYNDLVIANASGHVVANSNARTRSAVLGLTIGEEPWFGLAMKTQDGTQYVVRDLCESRVEPDAQSSLIYAAAVREGGDNLGRPLGAMGVYFDFHNEVQMILEDYMPKSNAGHTYDGWYSFFTDKSGTIIGSSDGGVIPVGTYAHLPRQHRTLDSGQRINHYLVFEGIESAIFSAKTDGYLEYPGLGWSSHLVVPKDAIFNHTAEADNSILKPEELLHSFIIPEVNKETYVKIQDDKESIQLISLNGIVFASKLGKRGVALGPIFDQITKTGDFATSMMEKLLAEMALGELQMNLQALENSSKQAIDLVDRNLFERAADIRWWATDHFFWRALENPSESSFEEASKRLKVINASYTMYRNLILADANGDVVACSRLELRNELRKQNVSEQEWFQLGMRTTASKDYAVQDVCNSPLERIKDCSLIYVGGVRRNGARQGEAIGVLGILFDWDTEAQTILRTCLPCDRDGEPIPGAAAFYTNANGVIIETTDSERFPVHGRPQISEQARALEKGESCSGLLSHQGVRYLIGSSRTQGYREYDGLAWCAHIVRPVDENG